MTPFIPLSAAARARGVPRNPLNKEGGSAGTDLLEGSPIDDAAARASELHHQLRADHRADALEIEIDCAGSPITNVPASGVETANVPPLICEEAGGVMSTTYVPVDPRLALE